MSLCYLSFFLSTPLEHNLLFRFVFLSLPAARSLEFQPHPAFLPTQNRTRPPHHLLPPGTITSTITLIKAARYKSAESVTASFSRIIQANPVDISHHVTSLFRSLASTTGHRRAISTPSSGWVLSHTQLSATLRLLVRSIQALMPPPTISASTMELFQPRTLL